MAPTRGDVLRITLEVNASADMTWSVITDPVPGGAVILGNGLGRDSEIAVQGWNIAVPPSRVEPMYAPEMFGETPNARVMVVAPK